MRITSLPCLIHSWFTGNSVDFPTIRPSWRLINPYSGSVCLCKSPKLLRKSWRSDRNDPTELHAMQLSVTLVLDQDWKLYSQWLTILTSEGYIPAKLGLPSFQRYELHTQMVHKKEHRKTFLPLDPRDLLTSAVGANLPAALCFCPLPGFLIKKKKNIKKHETAF